MDDYSFLREALSETNDYDYAQTLAMIEIVRLLARIANVLETQVHSAWDVPIRNLDDRLSALEGATKKGERGRT